MGRIHAVCVVLGLTIPLLPVLTTIIHSLAVDYSATEGLPSGLGFGLATFLPILCYTLNKDVVFFSFILPITLLMVMGITLLPMRGVVHSSDLALCIPDVCHNFQY